jgi:hypothetical protein
MPGFEPKTMLRRVIKTGFLPQMYGEATSSLCAANSSTTDPQTSRNVLNWAILFTLCSEPRGTVNGKAFPSCRGCPGSVSGVRIG